MIPRIFKSSCLQVKRDVLNSLKGIHTHTHFQHYNYDRVEKVVCLITSTSPILSDAEKTMARDLQSIHEQLNGLHRLLQKVPHPHLLLIMYTTPTSINNIHTHIYY